MIFMIVYFTSVSRYLDERTRISQICPRTFEGTAMSTQLMGSMLKETTREEDEETSHNDFIRETDQSYISNSMTI